MNTKFLFTLVVVALIATACTPALIDNVAPAEPAAAPADARNPVILPLTGNSASTEARDAQEPQQWSGEIFLSDSNSPDVMLQNAVDTDQQDISECMSEDSQTRRQSGCTE